MYSEPNEEEYYSGYHKKQGSNFVLVGEEGQRKGLVCEEWVTMCLMVAI